MGCYYAVSIGWQGGVHIQTCGHMLHLDCHDSYVKSLKVIRSLLPVFIILWQPLPTHPQVTISVKLYNISWLGLIANDIVQA